MFSKYDETMKAYCRVMTQEVLKRLYDALEGIDKGYLVTLVMLEGITSSHQLLYATFVWLFVLMVGLGRR